MIFLENTAVNSCNTVVNNFTISTFFFKKKLQITFRNFLCVILVRVFIFFQMAAGIFGHLKDIVLSHVQQEPTPDLSPDTLNALSALMVAQAQEAIYRKAAAGKGIRQCHKC